MTDYTKLVAALRNNDWSDACPCCDEAMCKDADCIILQAAAAIEALQADVEKKESRITGLGNRIFALEQQLPKRGEIVRCGECKHRKDSIQCPLWSEGIKTADDWFCADGEREVQE